jgi:hypothetical protein
MEPRPKSIPTPSRPEPAAPWAILWLGVMAAGTWIPLCLADRLAGWHQEQPATIAIQKPPGSQPLIPLAPVASSPIEGFKPSIASLPPIRSQLALDQIPSSPVQSPMAMATTDNGSIDTTSPIEPKPTLATSGSLLLGGPLGLESLQEKPMVPAARLEVALRSRAEDRLGAVPAHWRPAMQALLNGEKRVLPAEVVRLPAPHLRTAEEYPMAVKPDGIAETTVTPSQRSRETIERWAQRQSPNPEGSTRPVIVVLEPLAPDVNISSTVPVADGTEAQTKEAP